MSRSSIVAIVLFAAALLALLSIGPQTTRKIQATFFQLVAPFLKTGSGLEKQITSVRAGLKSLENVHLNIALLPSGARWGHELSLAFAISSTQVLITVIGRELD